MAADRLRISGLLLAAWLMMGPGTTSRAEYRIVDLGVLPGGTQSQGNAINAGGLVAGNSDLLSGATHAARFTDDG